MGNDINEVLAKYLAESLAVSAQAQADALASQEKVSKMEIAQAEKLGLRQELRDLKAEAVMDTYAKAADFMTNWFKVGLSHEENKARAELGLPEEKDVLAELADANLGKDPLGGMDYKLDEDEIKDSDNDAKDFDANPDNNDIDLDIDKWAKDNGLPSSDDKTDPDKSDES